jgi:SAM-dependent methyltransferase
MPKPVPANEPRTLDELRAHYNVERELADRLRSSTPTERHALYGTVYDELLERVPTHPLLTRKAEPAQATAVVAAQVKLLRPLLTAETTFLDIGSGDCALAVAVASYVKQVYAIDVSEAILSGLSLPDNVEARVSTGIDIPVPPESVDVAYSNQVMEHLHPDDAHMQLRNISACLRSGGRYVCITPNRLTGPHDISQYFVDEADGLHLKEYTVGELARAFRGAGFSRVRALAGARGRFISLPAWPVALTERLLVLLTPAMRRRLVLRLHLNSLLGIRVIATR